MGSENDIHTEFLRCGATMDLAQARQCRAKTGLFANEMTTERQKYNTLKPVPSCDPAYLVR
jgi:hypothetical protein